MKDLGIDYMGAELTEELRIRLAGKVEDNTGDDQLMGEAMKLTEAQYKDYY